MNSSFQFNLGNSPFTLRTLMLILAFLGVLAIELSTQAQSNRPDYLKTTYVYKEAPGCKIHADVYRLPGDDVRPAIFWIHGGALIGGDRNGIRKDQLDSYLEAGFAVVSIDYRLAPETQLPEIIGDLKDAWKWLRGEAKRLKIDRDRVAVVGHSAGGYLTLMSGFCLSPRPRALVSFYGYGDIAGDWYSKPDPYYSKQPAVSKEEAFRVVTVGPPTPNSGGVKAISENGSGDRFRFYLYCRQNGLWPQKVAGFDPDKEPRKFDPYCPVRNVTIKYPPTLLLHADQDTDVPYIQSVQMAAELKKQHVEHDLITITGGGHGFDGARKRDAKVAAAFDRVLAFLKLYLLSSAPR